MITGNEPAMPSSVCCNENGIYTGNDSPSSNGGNGLTIRQHFAAMAMQGLLSNPEWMKVYKSEKYLMESGVISEVAAKQADALINELNKKP